MADISVRLCPKHAQGGSSPEARFPVEALTFMVKVVPATYVIKAHLSTYSSPKSVNPNSEQQTNKITYLGILSSVFLSCETASERGLSPVPGFLIPLIIHLKIPVGLVCNSAAIPELVLGFSGEGSLSLGTCAKRMSL